jgi:sigma-E factor negative regulatory protein RseA
MVMSQALNEQSFPEEDLSALMDGELDAEATEAVCAHWRDDPAVRGRWHTYQLIGDVLRSDELASDGGRDVHFLSELRKRLANEPVVLAPAESAPARARRSWMAPAAVAAGFAAVAGVLVVTQMSGSLPFSDAPSGGALVAESAGSPIRPVSLQAASGAGANSAYIPSVTLNGQLVRDVRLDEYLAAHKKFGGSSMSGGPSGSLRNAAVDGSAR